VNHVHSADDECTFDQNKAGYSGREIVLCTKCNPSTKMKEILNWCYPLHNLFDWTYHCDKHKDLYPRKWLIWDNKDFLENTKRFKTHSFKRNGSEK
jgi:hypothetical protein